MGGIRVAKLGLGDESADQSKAFDSFSRDLWSNLLKEERDLRNRALQDVDEDEEDDITIDDKQEPIVRFPFFPLQVFFEITQTAS